MRRAGSALLRAAAVSLGVIACGPVGVAMAAPNLTIEHPVAESCIANGSPTFSGNTSDGLDPVTLKIYKGSSLAQERTGISPEGESWSTEASLADGQYTAVAEQTELGETTKAGPVTFNVDTGAPEVSIGSFHSPTNNPRPTFEGRAGTSACDLPEVSVTIFGEGIKVTGSAPLSAGAWKYTSPELRDGEYTAQVTQHDKTGGERGDSIEFTIDTTPPVVTIQLASPTTEAKPTLEGGAGTAKGDGPASVTIYKGSSPGGPVAAASEALTVTGGKWSYRPPKPLIDGTYTAQVIQDDWAGNEGKSQVTFEINTPVPKVTLSTATFVHRGTELVTGATPHFEGEAASGPEDVKSVTLDITSTKGKPVEVVGAVTGTTWTAGPVAALAQGTYTAQVTQSDEAKNIGKSEPPVAFTVDTTPPAVTITTPASGQKLHVSRPTFIGAAGTAPGDLPSVKLKIYKGGSATGKPEQELELPATAGKWTSPPEGPALPNGTYTAKAEQLDDVGNVGTSTTTFTIETKSPTVTMSMPGLVARGGTLASGPNPTFSGTAGIAPEDSASVIVNLFSGTSASGKPVRNVEGTRSGGTWTIGPVALAEGTYTAQAEQGDSAVGGSPGYSEATPFIVDATPPAVTLTSPANGSSTTGGSQLVTGSAGTAVGDLPEVIVQLFSGASVTGAPLQSVNVNAAGGAWSTTFGGLSAGTYTVRAEQADDVGNLGLSAAATFTVAPPGSAATHSPTPPSASFSWVPTSPHTGESVSLLSSSTDASSPITAFAWDLAGSGAFSAGGPVASTSFSTAGGHLVQLRVGDANGLSSVASETIEVTPPLLPLMRPFPIVRITATRVSSGVKLRLLSVQASAGARITVACSGRGCPVKSQSRVAAAGKVGGAPIAFRRFERSLPAGLTLVVRVSKPGVIGKYTSFRIRRGKLPVRTDACLVPPSAKPIPCPSS